jgi:hypothetical protein
MAISPLRVRVCQSGSGGDQGVRRQTSDEGRHALTRK